MKISILIPTYNRRSMVDEALQKILHYDDPVIHEIIVSENHGEDQTVDFLRKKYASIQKIKITMPPVKGGAISNWSHCLHLASGTHVHWHWSDDFLVGPMYSKAKIAFEQKAGDVLLFGANIVEGTQQHHQYEIGNEKISGKEALERLFRFQLPVSPAAYILPLSSVRKHFYIDIPNFENYRPMEIAMGTDALMIAGAITDSSGLRMISDTVIHFRSHEDSITVQNFDQLLNYKISFIHFLKLNKMDEYKNFSRNEFGNFLIKNLWKNSFIENVKLSISILKKEGVRSLVKKFRFGEF